VSDQTTAALIREVHSALASVQSLNDILTYIQHLTTSPNTPSGPN
jgi:hypothetical protein